MKKMILCMLFFSVNLCFSYCQPSISDYSFVAMVNGTVKKELVCQKNNYSLKSHILAKVLFYNVTYDETAVGTKDPQMGVSSARYTVEDSRKSSITLLQVEKKGVDIQSVPLLLGYHLAKELPLPKQLKVFAEDGGTMYDFHILNNNEKINTPLGELDTVKIFAEEKSGMQFTYWLWKKNHTMVKEDIREKGNSIFEATIISQSDDNGCCWR